MRSHSRSLTYELTNRLVKKLARPLRSAGTRLYKLGLRVQGEYGSTELLRPDPRTVAVDDARAEFSRAKFVAPNATLAGAVTLGEDSAVYYASQLHAFPGARVVVGRGAIVQDLALVKATEGRTTEIGELALCAPNCHVLNSKVGALAFIGAGARLSESEVEEGGVLAAGAVLARGRVGRNEVWAGNPAAFLRLATAEEQDHVNDLRQDYAKMNAVFREEEAKEALEVQDEELTELGLRTSDEDRELVHEHAIDEENHVVDEDTHDYPVERDMFIQWANFVKRFPEKQLKNVDTLHADFPEHLNVHNPNFKFAQRLEESLREGKKTPDLTLVDLKSFSHGARGDSAADGSSKK